MIGDSEEDREEAQKAYLRKWLSIPQIWGKRTSKYRKLRSLQSNSTQRGIHQDKAKSIIKDKETKLKAARDKKCITFKGTTIGLSVDLAETLQAKRD